MMFDPIRYLKVIISALAFIYVLSYGMHPTEPNFLANVNLLVHEGGHLVFFVLGHFLYVLGGSLMQVLMPVLFVMYFWRSGQKFAASFVGLWVAHNLFGVATYAADAQKMQLPLLGGDNSGHDWHYLLQATHLLPFTNIISGIIFWLGMIVLVVSGILCVAYALNDHTENPVEVEI